jgi:hypothetical protein
MTAMAMVRPQKKIKTKSKVLRKNKTLEGFSELHISGKKATTQVTLVSFKSTF